MNCLLCFHGAAEITVANTQYEPHAFVCDECAEDMFVKCEGCGEVHPSDDGEIIYYDARVYCDSDCFGEDMHEDCRYGTPYGVEAWKEYNAIDATLQSPLQTTTTDLGNALSNMLKVVS